MSRLLGWLVEIVPSTGRWRPVWCVLFSYYDDLEGCGCWRESGTRRWHG